MPPRIMPALSVLDLVPVDVRQTTAHAFASSLNLVGTAERTGYQRYWFGEHHNSPALASTSPAILIAAAAARTDRIRIGSGGVLLPLHPYSDIAEQFGTLDALAPDRIDLGLGRATSPQPDVTQLLARTADATPEQFEADVVALRALLAVGGAAESQAVSADLNDISSRGRTSPRMWLLGASNVTAFVAARLGLPFAYANHISGHSLERAINAYRTHYRPSPEHPEARVILSVAVATGRTPEIARARALPQLRMNARLRARLSLQALETIEGAHAERWDGLRATSLSKAGENWIIGSPDTARRRIADLAERWAVDEVMIWPVDGVHEDDPLDVAVGRRFTLEALAP